MVEQKNLANEIWQVAELLRGDFRQSEYGLVILPFTVLRRLECVLEPTRAAVLEAHETIKDKGWDPDQMLTRASGHGFYNTSSYTLGSLGVADTRANLVDYLARFSANAQTIFEQFEFAAKIDRLDEDKLLLKVATTFANIDLHPDRVSNHEMGLAFEHLIRRFAESANDTAGEHYTPRDVVRLATTLVFSPDADALRGDGVIRTIYDPTCGTGGFLSSGMEQIHEWNPKARVVPYGQELNAQTHAIAVADMMIKGLETDKIRLGNTLSDDQLYDQTFDYCLANPPFGVDWKKVQADVQAEAAKGEKGRFVAGLPRVSDGSLLFLMHLLDKRHRDKPTRMAIVLNGSPLFTGGAGSGESEIRRWVLEDDYVEAIVALPTDLFYNTGIATYVWVLTNRKDESRQGKVQLIDASGSDFWEPMRKSLGSKRRQLSEAAIERIARLHADGMEAEHSKVFDYTAFGYRRVTVERPLQLAFAPYDEVRRAALVADKAWAKWDEARQAAVLEGLDACEAAYTDRVAFVDALSGHVGKLKPTELKLLQKHLGEHDDEAAYCLDAKGNREVNPDLRDTENVPLGEDIHEYFAREVTPHVQDAWIDESKVDEQDGEVGIVGFEVPFNRHFYVYKPPRPLEEIDADLARVSREIVELLGEVGA